MIKTLIIALILVFSTSLEAKDNFFEVGVRGRNFKSKIETNDKHKNINSYNSVIESTNKTDIIAKFDLGFKSNSIRYYIRTAELKPSIEAGMKIKNNNTQYDIGILRDLQKEAYQNPYLLNEDRAETKINTYGVYIDSNYELEEFVYFDLLYKIKKDNYITDAQKNTTLDRDSITHILKGIYNYKAFFVGLEYQKNDAKGEASSFDRYGVELELKMPIKKLFLLARVGYYDKKFDAINPYFDKIQKNRERLILLYARYSKILNIPDTYIGTSYMYNRCDSNLNLFDEKIKSYTLTFGYQF